MNRQTAAATAIVLSLGAGSAIQAHEGATGVLKERMDAMMAMGKAMKVLAPMMQGAAPYDAEAVEDAASTIEEHAGEAMTEKFPEGSTEAPSEAKPAIWSDWDKFSRLAHELEVLAQGLQLAAANEPTGQGASADNMMGMMGGAGGDMPAMMGGSEGSGSGMSAMMGGTGGGGMSEMMGMSGGHSGDSGAASSMMGGSTDPEEVQVAFSAEDFADLPADEVFQKVTQTCAACHQSFRAEKK